MKKLLYIIVLLTGISVNAQVAINTDGTAPNNSAMLHVKSTTKGLLIPSMTTLQRTGIAAPGDGLIVYDLTNALLFQYQNGTWRAMITNEYWSKNSTDMYNVDLNVGIGNANPTEKLHVTGNIRSTGDVLLSGDIRMNNPSGILQFQNAGVNTGYVQLSGSNLRMGTNSGNATGNVVVRMNGNDLITINPQGDMNTEGKITTGTTGSKNLLPLCYGKVEWMATSSSTTDNATVTRTSNGIYEIYCNGLASSSTMIITMNAYAGGTYSAPLAEYISNGHFRVSFYNSSYPPNSDAGFSFIAYQ